MMGGMGRTFDGGYAEYTCVPVAQVVPFRSDCRLDDARRGARDAADRVRLADRRARRPARPDAADPRRHVVGRPGRRDARQAPRPDRPGHDRDRSAPARCTAGRRPRRRRRRRRSPRACASSCPAAWTRARTRRHADAARHAARRRACTASSASRDARNQWTVPDFYPIGYLPTRRAAHRLQRRRDRPARRRPAEFLDAVAAGRPEVPIAGPTPSRDPTAHADMEAATPPASSSCSREPGYGENRAKNATWSFPSARSVVRQRPTPVRQPDGTRAAWASASSIRTPTLRRRRPTCQRDPHVRGGPA